MHRQEPIAYEAEGREMEGWLMLPDHQRLPAPGILVIHEFMGLGDYLVRHLQNLAVRGYVVLAADMYGCGIRPGDAHTALACSRPLRGDRKRMRRLAAAALTCLQQLSFVDRGNIAAIGYSFGGCAALELARSGADLKAAVSVYGYLDAPLPATVGSIKARLLVFHGLHDPVVPESELAGFRQEMRAAGVDCRVVVYADAGHGFCNREMDGRQHPWNRYSPWHDADVGRTLATFLDQAFTG